MINTRYAISAVKPGWKCLRGKFHRTFVLKNCYWSCFHFSFLIILTDQFFEVSFTFLYSWNFWYTRGYRVKQTHSRYRSENFDHCDSQGKHWSCPRGEVPTLQETRMPAQANIMFEPEGLKVLLKWFQRLLKDFSNFKFSKLIIYLLYKR